MILNYVALLLSVCVCTNGQFVPFRNITWKYINQPGLQAQPVPFDPRGLPPQNNSWIMTASCCGYGPFSQAAVQNASDYYGLFDIPCMWPAMPMSAEWGYEFEQNTGNFPICGNLSASAYPAPASRDQALSRMNLYWSCRAAYSRAAVASNASAPILSETGHYLYSGLSAAANTGPTIFGSEVGENINSVNLHIASNRGSARQYASPYIIDISPWMQGYITDYSASKFWGAASSASGGHSLSLYQRIYAAVFMSGASSLIMEAGAVNAFLENVTAAGVFELSPLGVIGSDLYAFSHNGGDAEAVRGIPYVPIAVIQDLGGVGIGYFYHGLVWDVLPFSDVDVRCYAWLQALWAGSFTPMNEFGGVMSEAGYMVGTNSWGDIVDIVAPSNLSGDALLGASYRAVVLPGLNSPVNPQLVEALVTYVSHGGTVVLNVNDVLPVVSAFPENFFGVLLKSLTTVTATGVHDVTTGWDGPAFECVTVQATSSSPAYYYIRTGGTQGVNNGWDGGLNDKCCSLNADTCMWYSSLQTCLSALANPPCRTCQSSNLDVGCPEWPSVSQPSSVDVAPALLTTAEVSISLQTITGDVPAVTVNAFEAGTVVLQLVPGVTGQAISPGFFVPHLFDRLGNDTAAVLVTTNATIGMGVQVLTNRVPSGWLVTLINNNGVTKQPSLAPVLDSSADLMCTVSIRPHAIGPSTLIAAYNSQVSAATPEPLPVDANGCVNLLVPAGSVRVVKLDVA